MVAHPMDNPIWHSLRTEQRSFAIGDEHAIRYPSAVAPFVAIEADTDGARKTAADLVAPGEAVYFISVAPAVLSDWDLLSEGTILQMMWNPEAALAIDRNGIVELSSEDAAAMVDLTGIAFPGFFRERTFQLGRYLGIKEGARLVSMAGERMRAAGFQEISGVCTHPDYTGRGYAAKLNARMIEMICERGVQPFLHVSSHNTRAHSLYRHLGFVERATLRLWHVKRR